MRNLFYTSLLVSIVLISSCGNTESEKKPKEPNTKSSIVWERLFQSGIHNGPLVTVKKMFKDDKNNIYCIGGFRKEISFNAKNQDDFSLLLKPKGNDGFVLKLDKDGNSIWAKQATSISSDFFESGVLHKNKLYLTKNSSSIWIYDLDGKLVSESKNNLGKNAHFDDLEVGKDGSIYFTGFNMEGFGYFHNVYGKLDDAGKVVWMKEFNLGKNFKKFSRIDISSDGSIYITGNAGKEKVFINKIKKDGSIVWTKYIDSEQVTLEQFLITSNDKLFLGGKFTGFPEGVDLDPGKDSKRIKNKLSGYAQFIVLLDTDGNYIWGDDVYSKGFNTAFKYAQEVNGSILLTFDNYNGVKSINSSSNYDELIKANKSHDGFLKIDLASGKISNYVFNDNKDYVGHVADAFLYLPNNELVYARFLNGNPGDIETSLLISKQTF